MSPGQLPKVLNPGTYAVRPDPAHGRPFQLVKPKLRVELPKVQSRHLCGFVVDRLDVVPVWADDECCIVVAAVLWAQARRTIVLTTGIESCAIEGIDLVTTVGRERQVKVGRLLVGLVQA